MPRINVYLPDDLARAVREADLPVSAICQASLEQAVRRLSSIRQLVASDVEPQALASRLPRFMDKAVTALRLAVERARTSGCDVVGTEHLLDGLLAEGSNLSLSVLRAMEVESGAVRRELDVAASCSQPSSQGAARRISDPLGTALVGAVAASNALGHNYVGCEHLLIGLISEPDGTAGQVLRKLGADDRQARRAVAASLHAIEYWQERAQDQNLGHAGDPGAAPPPGRTLWAAVDEAIKRELQPLVERIASIERRLPPAAELLGMRPAGEHLTARMPLATWPSPGTTGRPRARAGHDQRFRSIAPCPARARDRNCKENHE